MYRHWTTKGLKLEYKNHSTANCKKLRFWAKQTAVYVLYI